MSTRWDGAATKSVPAEPEQSLPVAGGCTRRNWLTGALCGGTAGLAGGIGIWPALGRSRSTLDEPKPALPADNVAATSSAPGAPDPRVDFEQAFRIEARQIQERHRLQTAESVATLKKKYEAPAFGRVNVWNQIERLAQCVDPTDTGLWGLSQWMHVRQTLAGMEQEGIDDPDLFVIAMLHDLGKLFLEIEAPENVVCGGKRIDEVEPEAGLDALVYQFGHGELIYSRIKDHVPDHIAWTVRYHNIDLLDAAPFMNARDEAHAEKYLLRFRRYDTNFKSVYSVPRLNMAKYRALIEQYFPAPILF